MPSVTDLRSVAPASRAPANAGHGYAHATALWSRETAREIVLVIAQEAESGQIAPGAAMDLIDRVWQRAAPESAAAQT